MVSTGDHRSESRHLVAEVVEPDHLVLLLLEGVHTVRATRSPWAATRPGSRASGACRDLGESFRRGWTAVRIDEPPVQLQDPAPSVVNEAGPADT